MNKRSLCGICWLLGWSGAGPAFGQTSASASTDTGAGAAPSTDTSQIQEVIVTAQKRSERESDVPMSITAASGDQLAQLGVTSPADLQQVVPGFNYSQGAKGSPIYTLRGIGFYTESIGVAPTVSVYSDQVPLPFSRMTEGASLDLERVEVLKGPQGTLFGQNSTGGAINYIAAKPTSDFQVGADVTYGRFNEVDLGGFVSGPLSDTAEARLAVRTESRDGWQENYVATGDMTGTGQNLNGERSFNTARTLIDWHPSDTLRWEFNLNGWVDHSDAPAWSKIAYYALQPGGYAGSPGYPNLQAQLMAYPNAPQNDRAAGFDLGTSLRRNNNFYQFSARGDWDVTPSIALTTISAYSHLNVYDPVDEDGTDLPDAFLSTVGGATSYSEELRLAGSALQDNKLKWLVGGNFEYDDTRDQENVYINGTNSGFGATRFQTLNFFSDQVIHTAAAFGNLDYELVDGLTLQGGVRYTNRMDSFQGCLADSGLANGIGPGFAALSSALSGSPTVIAPGACLTLGPDNKPLPVVSNSLNEDNVSYRQGLQGGRVRDPSGHHRR
jgi:iron complex outermembrane recepter protein